MKAFLSWSGGKDAAMALYQTRQQANLQVAALLTHINAAHDRVSMHGVRRELLVQQAASLQLPLHTVSLPEQPSMAAYETAVAKEVQTLKAAGMDTALYGDLFLEDLKAYREQQMAALGIRCQFPLWQQDSTALLRAFIEAGFKAIVVCVNGNLLPPSFCGRMLDEAFLNDLPAGVDPCGERGEYHSFVVDGPLFSSPIAFTTGEQVYRAYATPNDPDDNCFTTPQPPTGFYFQDLLPA